MGNSWLSVADFTTSSVQVNPSGGGGTVNEGVPIGILMPSSHQKSTWFESVARADPLNRTTTANPNMRATATITTVVAPPRRKRAGITPSPFVPTRPADLDQRFGYPQGNHREHSSPTTIPPPPNGSASSISCQGRTHQASSQLTIRWARPFVTRRMDSQAAWFLWQNSS